MSETGNTWPPDRRDPRDPRDPRLIRGPGGIQPPLPLHHDPRDRDPRLIDPRRAGDSPWRRTQRRSRPEAASWPTAPAGPVSHDAGRGGFDADRGGFDAARGGHEYDPREPEPYGPPGEDDGYDEAYGTGNRFVPGFGGYEEDDADDQPHRGRAARRRSGRSRGADGPKGPDGPRGPRRHRRHRLRWIAPLVAVAVVLIPLGIGGSYAYSLYMSKYHPADYSGPGTGHVVVQVPAGSSPTSLGPRLTRLGVVASARAFVLAAEHSPDPSGLLPGFYGMRLHMKASLAYALLLNQKNLVQVTVTIPEGWRLSQIVAYLGAKSGIPASAYQAVLTNPARLHLPAYSGGKPEGYLFPATYEVQPHEAALGVLAAMVRRFGQEAAAVNLPAAARRVHLTEGQVIIMASLVQAEGGRLADYPKIARVIDNRLSQGIPLQLDSTVLYGLNAYGIIASDAQLSSDSPYNTYKRKGLTPGPIDSPGAAAIAAVLNLAAGNWIYFVTVNPRTGETLFTASQTQFEQYRAELEHNLGQGKG